MMMREWVKCGGCLIKSDIWRWDDSYFDNEDTNTFNKDSTADEGEEEEENHDNAYFCFAFLSTLISENRTKSAAFREVNQAAQRATALSFYVPISLYISPISISFIPLISPFFNQGISMWLIHLRAHFVRKFYLNSMNSLSPDFQTSHSERTARRNTKQCKQAKNMFMQCMFDAWVCACTF